MIRTLFLAMLALAQDQQAGFVFSRGYADQASVMKNITPLLMSNFTVIPGVTIGFEGRDFITQVTVSLSNLNMTEFIIQPSNVNISFTSPKFIGLGISNFTCNIYYNYTEVGFDINKTGSAITTFSASSMIINLIAYFDNGTLAYMPDYSNFTMKIGLSSTISDSMSGSIISLTNTNMRNYWNEPQHQEVVVKQMDSYIENDEPDVDYNYKVPGTSMFMKGNLESPGFEIGNDYVSSQLNGTFGIVDGNIDYSLGQYIQLPYRVNAQKYSGMSQVLVSNYSLTTYFQALSDYYGFINATVLPAGYPNYMTTNNGYFPELYSKYGTASLSLISTLKDKPFVFILSTGILIRMKIRCNLQVMTSDKVFQTVVSFYYTFDYSCIPTIKGGVISGSCYKPRSVKLSIIQNTGGVSTLGLKKFISDLVQTSFFAGDTHYYFPTIPLSYPNGTVITEYYVDYGPSYYAVSFNLKKSS